MHLYGYFRSSASYRVRIALNLKGVACTHSYLHLTRGGGEHHSPDFRMLNPQGMVPALVEDGGGVLTQSLAIVEYLDEVWPEPPLLPADPLGRARVRSLAQVIACDIHPLNNLRVLQYLGRRLDLADAVRDTWYRHWIGEGFTALEAMLAGNPATGTYCHGEAPGMADLCLVPQVYNARRYDCDLSGYPTLVRIADACEALPAFRDAAPDNQPDAT